MVLSNASYDNERFYTGKAIKISVVDLKKTSKELDPITVVTEEDYKGSNHGKSIAKIKNLSIAHRGSEPISSGQYLEKQGIYLPRGEDVLGMTI